MILSSAARNGMTFCMGSLASSPTNDPVTIASTLRGRIRQATSSEGCSGEEMASSCYSAQL